MNFNVVPPLTFTSAISVTSMLYYHQNLIKHDMLSPTVLTAAENVEFLDVPETVKEIIHSLVQPVGEEICGWLWEFREILPRDMNLFNKICWTPLGAVDYRRTAGRCIAKGDIRYVRAYKLACVSGNYEAIAYLWPQVEDYILCEISQMGFCLGENPKPLLLWPTIWAAYLNNQMEDYRLANDHDELINGGESDIAYLCRRAVKCNNVGTANFFIKQLPVSEKKDIVKGLIKGRIFVHVSDFDPRMFLALLKNHLDEEGRREVLFRYKADILVRILKWPSAHLFMTFSEYLWKAFPFASLHKILERICVKIMQMQVPAVYVNIFITLWSKVPMAKKRNFYNKHIRNTLFNLFRPTLVKVAIPNLFKAKENAYQHFVKKFLGNANSVCNILVEENKFKAFKSILHQNFSRGEMVDDLESVYIQHTHAYVDEYYGVLNDCTSSEYSDSDVVAMDE